MFFNVILYLMKNYRKRKTTLNREKEKKLRKMHFSLRPHTREEDMGLSVVIRVSTSGKLAQIGETEGGTQSAVGWILC